jgi:hypothetical protein
MNILRSTRKSNSWYCAIVTAVCLGCQQSANWHLSHEKFKSLSGKCLHSEFECVTISALVRQSLKNRESFYSANLPVRFRFQSFGTPNIQSLCIQASRDFVFLSFGILVVYGTISAAMSSVINPSRMKRSLLKKIPSSYRAVNTQSRL